MRPAKHEGRAGAVPAAQGRPTPRAAATRGTLLRPLLVLATLLVAAGTGRAAEGALEADFAAAVAAYRAQDYGRAADLFAEVAAAEPDDARRSLAHANAGTAAARAEQLGRAVWHLEAARRLAPRDPVVARNLAGVRLRLGTAPSEARQFSATLRRLPLLLDPREAAWVVWSLVAAALLLLGARRARWLGSGARLAALGLLLLAGLAAGAEHLARAADAARAVVLAPATARAEPGEGGQVLFRLDEGAVVRAEERRGDWRLVETEGGARGWMPAERVRDAGR